MCSVPFVFAELLNDMCSVTSTFTKPLNDMCSDAFVFTQLLNNRCSLTFGSVSLMRDFPEKEGEKVPPSPNRLGPNQAGRSEPGKAKPSQTKPVGIKLFWATPSPSGVRTSPIEIGSGPGQARDKPG